MPTFKAIIVSKEARDKDVADLLTTYVARIGDRARDEVIVGPHDEGFAGFLATTWVDLAQDGFLSPQHTIGTTGKHWELTADGWQLGLRLSRQFHSTELRARAATLARGLKALVQGRSSRHAEIVDERDLGPQLGLPIGWVRNALESDLLTAVFLRKNMSVEYDSGSRCFRVPTLFGLE